MWHRTKSDQTELQKFLICVCLGQQPSCGYLSRKEISWMTIPKRQFLLVMKADRQTTEFMIQKREESVYQEMLHLMRVVVKIFLRKETVNPTWIVKFSTTVIRILIFCAVEPHLMPIFGILCKVSMFWHSVQSGFLKFRKPKLVKVRN